MRIVRSTLEHDEFKSARLFAAASSGLSARLFDFLPCRKSRMALLRGLMVAVMPMMAARGRRSRRAAARGRRRHADVDDDRVGIDRRIVREVVRVAQQELEGMAPGRECKRRLGLTAAEVKVIFIVRDRLV